MSRMSAWNRPSKHAAIPPPYYITSGDDTPYCHTCGRVMNSRKAVKHSAKVDKSTRTPVKYCSERCRRRKPGSQDRDIEQAFLTLLEGGEGISTAMPKSPAKSKKGDSRILVRMDAVEDHVFGKQPKSEKRRVGKRNVLDPNKWRSVDMESSESEDDSDVDEGDSGGAALATVQFDDREMIELRPKKVAVSKEVDEDADGEPNSRLAGDAPENVANMVKRDQGQKRAEQKEMVRRAARRAVVFGFPIDDNNTENPSSADSRRKCEAVVNGSIVEPSFAKGNWGIRWRD